jgi:arginine deiminase
MQSPIKVYSEIGELKEVVVKRPGKELGNISPKEIKHYLLSSYID